MTMPRTGITSTESLDQSIPTVQAASRLIREYIGVMPNLVRNVTLEPGTGNTWYEVHLAQLVAQNISETEDQMNPQMIEDTDIQITPEVSGLETLITDRMMLRITPHVAMRIGALAQNAIQRKKDQDGLLVFNAGEPLGGESTTQITGLLSAAGTRMLGNDLEPSASPRRAVLHPFQVKFIQDSLTFNVDPSTESSRRPVEMGLSQDAFINGWMMGSVYGIQVYSDGNVIRQQNAADNGQFAVGGIFPEEGIILVQGRMPKVEAERRPSIGMGAYCMYHRDEYAYGLGQRDNNWVFKLTTDASVPTS